MKQRTNLVRQIDWVRVAKAMQQADVTEWRLDIAPDGTKSLFVGGQAHDPDAQNDWD